MLLQHVALQRKTTMSEMRRLHRQFLTMLRAQNPSTLDGVAASFVRYVNSNLDV